MADPIGIEWVIDAGGCDVAALRDAAAMERLFAAVIDEASLTPVGPARWHQFPPPGGLTGLQMLTESHLACHTFPEHASLCLNVFCCVARPEWNPDRLLAAIVGARDVHVRRIERRYGSRLSSALAAASIAGS